MALRVLERARPGHAIHFPNLAAQPWLHAGGSLGDCARARRRYRTLQHGGSYSVPEPALCRLRQARSVGLTAPLDANEFMLSPDYLQLWRETPAPFETVTTVTAGTTTCDLTEARPERLTCA